MEWPSRLYPHEGLLPPIENRLDINLSIVPSTERRVMTLKAASNSTWTTRLTAIVDEGFFDDMLEDDNE